MAPSGQALPRWSTRRRYERPTYGGYWGKVAAAMGQPYMPWQQHVADIAGEVDHEGKLCYRKVVVTVPRQSGKTTLILSVVAGRAEAGPRFGGRQHMVYAAQTREDARKKWLDEYVPVLEATPAMRGRFRKRIANGSEKLTFWSSGSTFGPIATKDTSGHGQVLDFGCLDETFAQKSDAVEMAWEPATVTRPMAQLWFPSTAGDSTSTYFRAMCDAGIVAVQADRGYGIAYIEYSAPPDCDPYDEDVWRATMPALGITQPIEAIRSIAHGGMKLNTWKRAFLNIWVDKASADVLDSQKWRQLKDPDTERKTRPLLTIDISADRKHACIGMGAATPAGIPLVRIIDYRAGTGWVVDRILQLREQYEVIDVVIDGAGPANSLVPELEDEYVHVTVMNARDMAGACGAFYDAVEDLKLRHFGEPALELAVTGAEKRELGDAWAWTRKASMGETRTDISPLVAVTMAHWAQIKFGDDASENFPGSFQS
jgi:phage terminase large subunit-like protein